MPACTIREDADIVPVKIAARSSRIRYFLNFFIIIIHLSAFHPLRIGLYLCSHIVNAGKRKIPTRSFKNFYLIPLFVISAKKTAVSRLFTVYYFRKPYEIIQSFSVHSGFRVLPLSKGSGLRQSYFNRLPGSLPLLLWLLFYFCSPRRQQDGQKMCPRF